MVDGHLRCGGENILKFSLKIGEGGEFIPFYRAL